MSTLTEGIQTYPDEKKLHFALAEMLIGDKSYHDALDVLTRMPGGTKEEARWLELSAYCAEGLGRDEEAEQDADAIIASDSSSSKAWNLKGAVAFKKNLPADAEKFFMRAIESDRGFGEAYANLGALRWVNGKREEAFTLFEKAFILSPTLGDIVTNYYTAVVSLSKLPEAVTLFKEAIRLHPFNRRLQFILIDNLLQQGKYREAMTEMENALAVFGVDDDTLTVALKLRETVETKKTETRGDRELKTEIHGDSVETDRDLKVSISLKKSPSFSQSPASISLCMIVKNEEKNIIRALQGAKPLVDEMVVVDTGSTDRTKKIAKAFGAKVYDFPWNDSFSDARNFSLSKASGDWILVLDADEVISPLDYGKLKELIETEKNETRGDSETGRDSAFSTSLNMSQPVSNHQSRSLNVAYSFTTRNYVGPISINWNPNDGQYKEEAGSGWFPSIKVRLFPNDSRIRFERNVHEIVEDSLKRIGAEIKPCDIPIHHYGKLNREDIRAKGEEYYQLGKKKLSMQGDQNANALFELAMQASELEKYDEALDLWRKLIRLQPDLEKAHHGLGTCYFRLGRYEEARAAFARAMQVGHGSKDQIVMYATSELLAGDAGAAVLLLEALLKEDPSYPLALLGITAAYFCAGRKDKGREYAGKVGDTQFGLATYLADIAKMLVSVNRFDYAISLLEAAVETGNATDEIRKLIEECGEKKRD